MIDAISHHPLAPDEMPVAIKTFHDGTEGEHTGAAFVRYKNGSVTIEEQSFPPPAPYARRFRHSDEIFESFAVAKLRYELGLVRWRNWELEPVCLAA